MIKARLLLLLCVTTLSCQTDPALISRDAESYNKSFDQIANEQILLNVVRAMERRPMRVTNIGSVSMTRKVDFSTGLAIPFAEGISDDSGSLSASGGITPSYSVTNLDSQEFMRGFLSPVKEEYFRNYWEAGYNREMLLYLFVERIEISHVDDPSKAPVILRNSPKNIAAFSGFRSFIASASHWQKAQKQVGPKFVGPPFQGLSPDELAEMTLEAKEQKLDLVRVCEACEAGKSEKGKCLCAPCATDRKGKRIQGSCREVYRFATAAKETEVIRLVVPRATTPQNILEILNAPSDEDFVTQDLDKAKLELVLRSPQGIIYFLGELLQAAPLWSDSYPQPTISTSVVADVIADGLTTKQVVHRPWNLFQVVEIEPGSPDPILSIEFEGVTYGIPGDGSAGRSLACIDIVNQVIALQRSYKEVAQPQSLVLVGN